MKTKHTLLFFISIFLFSSYSIYSQDKKVNTNDSISKNNPYGLRLGIDLARPIQTLADSDFTGFEIMADFRISHRFYIAAELGRDQDDQVESNLVSSTNGGYIKIGADFNAYNNWVGMNNAIFTGLRYGFSTFTQELTSFGIYTGDNTFPGTTINETFEYSGLTAHWAELIFGIKAEVFKNLFLSVQLQLKHMISDEKPENFDNLYVPGFNRTYDYSEFGAGYGFGVSYLIPFFKK